MGFAGVTQLFPGVILGLFSKRVTTAGIFAGLLAGIVLSVALMLTGRDPYHGLNAGFLALGLNFAVTAAVTALTPEDASGFDQPELPLAAHSPEATFS
jgi:SSS family solute:Na+ symporter